MGRTAWVIPVKRWEDECLAGLGAALEARAGETCVLVDAQLAAEIPQVARQWVADGKAMIVRGFGALGANDALDMAARLARAETVLVLDTATGEEVAWQPAGDAASPEVSVLVPMYQAGAYANEAIASVYEQIRRPSELVVVDDGSEDDSARHACEALGGCPDWLRAVLVLAPHRGQAAARNAALACSSGEWVFYLDADDVLEPTALGSLLGAAEANPSAGLVCACCQDFISPDLTPEEAARLKINPQPYRRMLSGCTITRKAIYDAVGPYDETLPSSETAQWMLRMKDAGVEVLDINDVTLRRRYHRNNFGRRDRKTQLASYMAIIKQRRGKRAE